MMETGQCTHFLEENVRCSCLVFLLLTYFRYLCCIKKIEIKL